MPKFVEAYEGKNRSVVYVDGQGNTLMYLNGDRAWRNNNPGNLRTGKVSRRNGQIGTAGGFAVFPNYESGHIALVDSLTNMHGNKNLRQLIRVYAPATENDTPRYLKFLRKMVRVREDKKIRDFSKAEFERLWRAIERKEGNRPLSPRFSGHMELQTHRERRNSKGN